MRLFTYILILSTFMSCESEISNESGDYKKYVVVNSIISTDSSWVVDLHYSSSIFDRSDFKPVEDAIVHISVLRDDENSQEEIQEFILDYDENGRYIRDNEPQEGRNYKMTIEVDGEEICAETYVPEVLTAEIREREPGDTQITIDIADDNSRENYYAYELIETAQETIQEEDYSVGEDVNPGEGTGQNVSNPIPTLNKNKGLISAVPTLTDNAGSIVVTLGDDSGASTTDPNLTAGTDPGIDVNPSVGIYTLKVWAISLDYYNYLLSVQENNLPNSEKPHYNYYSNVNNGGGIFAGYNLKVFENVQIER